MNIGHLTAIVECISDFWHWHTLYVGCTLEQGTHIEVLVLNREVQTEVDLWEVRSQYLTVAAIY